VGACISDLAWSHRGVEPAEVSEIAVDPEVFQTLLGQRFTTWGTCTPRGAFAYLKGYI